MSVLTEALYTQLCFFLKKAKCFALVILACWETLGWGILESPTPWRKSCRLEISVPASQAGFFPVPVQAGAEGSWRGRGPRDSVWPHRLLLSQGRGDSPTPLTPSLPPQLGERQFLVSTEQIFSVFSCQTLKP